MTERAMQAVLAVLAVWHVGFGLLALIAPDTFFDQIGHYGIENSHYVGDVGAFYLAAGVALAISIVRPAWRAPLLWLGALWYGFHAINHLFDTGEAKSEARGWTDTLLIAAGRARGLLAGAGRRTAQRRTGGARLRVFVAGASGAMGMPARAAVGGRRTRGDRDDAAARSGSRRSGAAGATAVGLRRLRRRGAGARGRRGGGPRSSSTR